MHDAALIGYLFHIDPVQALSGSRFDFEVRKAATRWLLDQKPAPNP